MHSAQQKMKQENREKILKAIIEKPQTFGELESHFKAQPPKERLTAPTLAKHLKDLMKEGGLRKEFVGQDAKYFPTERILDTEQRRKRTVASALDDLKRRISPDDEDIFVSMGRRMRHDQQLTEEFMKCVAEFYLLATSEEMRRSSQKHSNANEQKQALKKYMEKRIQMQGKLRDPAEMISYFRDFVKALRYAVLDDIGEN